MRSTPAEQRLLFRTTIEGMLRCLGQPIAPALVEQLRALGFDVTQRLLPGYPIERYLALVDFIGQVRHPQLEPDARDYALGVDFIRGFQDTLLGNATLGMARALGPKRYALRLPVAMRSVNNYANAGTRDDGERDVFLWSEPVYKPHYHRGVFEEAGRLTWGPSYRVDLLRAEGERAEFRITWA